MEGNCRCAPGRRGAGQNSWKTLKRALFQRAVGPVLDGREIDDPRPALAAFGLFAPGARVGALNLAIGAFRGRHCRCGLARPDLRRERIDHSRIDRRANGGESGKQG